MYKGVLPKPDIIQNTPIDKLPFWFPTYLYHQYIDEKTNTITRNLWSGHSILSVVIPDINLTKKNGY